MEITFVIPNSKINCVMTRIMLEKEQNRMEILDKQLTPSHLFSLVNNKEKKTTQV